MSISFWIFFKIFTKDFIYCLLLRSPNFQKLIYLIWTNFYLVQRDTLLESIKFYLIQINHSFKSKKIFKTNNLIWFNQIFFLSVVRKLFLGLPIFSQLLYSCSLKYKLPHIWNINKDKSWTFPSYLTQLYQENWNKIKCECSASS